MGARQSDLFLEFVAEASRRRDDAEQHFRRTLAAARAADVPLARIAQAAGLSVSRIHALTEQEKAMGISDVPASSVDAGDDLLVVAAGKIAWQDYLDYHAYLCQTDRAFRDTDHMGFYRRGAIEAYFPRIRFRRDNVEVSRTHASALGLSGNAFERELSQLLSRILDTSRAYDTELYQVFLLSPPDDPATIRLEQPIRHETNGRGSAFTQGTRYVSEAIVRGRPRTTEAFLSSPAPRVPRAPGRQRRSALNKGLTDPQFDGVPKRQLRYWRDFWQGKTLDKYWEKGFTRERAALDLALIETEIAARAARSDRGSENEPLE